MAVTAAATVDAGPDQAAPPKVFTVPWATFTASQIRELLQEGQLELQKRGQPLDETTSGKAARMKAMLDPACAASLQSMLFSA